MKIRVFSISTSESVGRYSTDWQVSASCLCLYLPMGLLGTNIKHVRFRGKLEEALEQFRLQLEYTRTMVDCQNAYNLIESIKAQMFMQEKFSLSVPNLYNIISGGMPMP